jgi:hypothetical protein
MRLRGVEKTMKLNRRHFLAQLVAVGATVALPVALADATPAQVNSAWKQLLKAPWYFDVTESDTIIDSSHTEPTIRSDVFYVDTGDRCSVNSLTSDIEDCYPLTSYFQQLTLNELNEAQCALEDDGLGTTERTRLFRLVAALDDIDGGWVEWIRLEGTEGLPRFKQVVQTWLASAIEWDDLQCLPSDAGAQGRALEFFDSLPFETIKAIGVVTIQGEHPGSTYYAAELTTSIEKANIKAAELKLPFRFKHEGSDAENLKPIGASAGLNL